MRNRRACPHCGSPARGNPCWWFLGAESLMRDAAFDPPCVGDEYDADQRRAFRRTMEAAGIIAAVILGIAAAIFVGFY